MLVDIWLVTFPVFAVTEVLVCKAFSHKGGFLFWGVWVLSTGAHTAADGCGSVSFSRDFAHNFHGVL